MLKVFKTISHLNSFILVSLFWAAQLFTYEALSRFGQEELICLEQYLHPAIIETRKISVMGYPHAFNPSLARWKNGWLMSFREKYWAYDRWVSLIGVACFDHSFCQIGAAQILQTGSLYSADPRLVWVDDKLYIVYNDKEEDRSGAPNLPSRIYMGRLAEYKWGFKIEEKRCFSDFPYENPNKPEKNWVPFSYKNALLFAYSLQPHVIFFPSQVGFECFSICRTISDVAWKWGQLRGGTPAIFVDGRYLAFFHSSLLGRSQESQGEEMMHYFIGAYTFHAREPFELERISPQPIIGSKFYAGQRYKPFGVPVQVVFPGGLAEEKDHLWLAFGRQDHEIWLAKIHTKTLLDSLVSLSECPEDDTELASCEYDPISD